MSSKGSSALSTKRAAAAAAAASNRASAAASDKKSEAKREHRKDDESNSSDDDDDEHVASSGVAVSISGAGAGSASVLDTFTSPGALLSLASSSSSAAAAAAAAAAAENPLAVASRSIDCALAASTAAVMAAASAGTASDAYSTQQAMLGSSTAAAAASASANHHANTGLNSSADEPGAKRHKSKWARDVSRLIGQHIPFQQFAPYNESGNTRNLLRGYCKMCTRKVTICCKKCHVFLCIEVFADQDGQETKSCWEVFHTVADPDQFMCKSSSNKRQEKLHRQQLATATHTGVGGASTGGAGVSSSSSPTGIFALSAEERDAENQPAMQPVELESILEDGGKAQKDDDEAATVTFSWENKDKKKRARGEK